ncbi:MAG TPA: hypothetical protein DDZ22_17275 [Massilia sp.]|nr:hypothetical protein [Massilia sp.]
MDPENRDDEPADNLKFTRQSVRALAVRHATIFREARDSGADLNQVTREHQAELNACMAGLNDEECQRFIRMYAEEMSDSAEKLLAEAVDQRYKRAMQDYQRGSTADRAATWLFVVLVLVFLLLASEA